MSLEQPDEWCSLCGNEPLCGTWRGRRAYTVRQDAPIYCPECDKLLDDWGEANCHPPQDDDPPPPPTDHGFDDQPPF